LPSSSKTKLPLSSIIIGRAGTGTGAGAGAGAGTCTGKTKCGSSIGYIILKTKLN
jgi:hypothetical protein